MERIGDEVDFRGEDKEPDFRRAAARRMGSTVADPDCLAAADEQDHDRDDADDASLGEAVVQSGLSALGMITDSALRT